MRILTEIEAKVLMTIGSSKGAVHPVAISRRTGIKLSDVERACEWAVRHSLAHLIENSYYGHYDIACRHIMACDTLRDAIR